MKGLLVLMIHLFPLLLLPCTCNAEKQQHRIFPAAKVEKYTTNSTIFRIVDPTHFDMLVSSESDVLEAAKKRFLEQSFFSGVPDFPEDYPVNPNNATLVPLQKLVLHVASNTTTLQHGTDESYSLIIGSNSTALLNATTVFGILRGLETFSQLLKFGWMQSHHLDGTTDASVFVIHSTPLYIEDAPEYSYRGLLIDSSRHFLPIPLILANLDVMAMNKLNVLHWHVTDSQSFPYLSKRYPELAQKGAFSKRHVYTPNDVLLIVQKARLRGIRVIPEFDLPGHAMAISKSHPEVMTQNCSDVVDPTKNHTLDFVSNLYSEIFHLFPDNMIHVGGDEVDLECWNKSTTIQSWMKQHDMHNVTQLLDYFEHQLFNIVHTHNKTPIVWQEVYNSNVTLPRNTIIDVWKGFDNTTLYNATHEGYKVILSGCWYLDHLQDDVTTLYQKCIPRNFTATPQQHSRVIGGHASMWGERVDASNFIPRVWPRASAAAERLWTGSMKSAERSFEDRVIAFRCHMVARGIAASPIQPGCCEREPSYVHEKKKKQQRFVVHNDGQVMYD